MTVAEEGKLLLAIRGETSRVVEESRKELDDAPLFLPGIPMVLLWEMELPAVKV